MHEGSTDPEGNMLRDCQAHEVVGIQMGAPFITPIPMAPFTFLRHLQQLPKLHGHKLSCKQRSSKIGRDIGDKVVQHGVEHEEVR